MTTTQQPTTPPPTFSKAVLRVALMTLFVGTLLFGVSGDIYWLGAWIVFGLMILNVVSNVVIMAFLHPDLMLERMRWREHANAKAWDKKIMPLMAVFGSLSILLVSALQHRFAPSLTAPWQWLAGTSCVLLGQMFGTWAVASNRFFSAIVRIQTDRGHVVIDHGPYAIVRHPGYAGAFLVYLGIPLLLGAWWAFVPSAFALGLLFYRTAREDQTLCEELDGYAAYTQRVRFRLFPGLW